ncbi:MAG: tRNA uridine(34) 5-carboxymethylaminomethyl modification radical SAM/GNAT enzyme Elp3 [Nitrososphaeria archaeon]|nr:tRNA uridine(34) 5-carboxymethylaminomethyl modification radical SAM/GNAT enzyme Elp3 [Nitrososphaeria archaeon]NIN52287.1 tRNA uridine(34) 5-carboxymethylaminomethyl modification radical SAM/GNAT enzyme Elp3 [Nitrososphaeria archaeon]NIQ32765.1 tRNA uridine(34) 5-carboxymethylaminomethyl modification radical SAM/GNAT enzyme Elp3 [Nitrososphaeria archaeon]
MDDPAFVEACREIAKQICEGNVKTEKEISRIKAEACRRYRLQKFPSNPEIIRHSGPYRVETTPILRLKPTRGISGIAIISIMTEPYECPHGRCTYCPHYVGAPISYTGQEPAARRGIENLFDPTRQIRQRLKQLEEIGHRTQKVDLIVQGGTFNTTPVAYRERYMIGVMEGILGWRPKTYEESLTAAESSHYRLVGMTLETRPDQVGEAQINWMLKKGFTRVELGVQTLFDDIYMRVKRGHKVKDVVEATKRLKDSVYKVCYHIMLNLPGTDCKRDLKMFEALFRDERFKPDALKIYPTLVLEGTELYEMWLRGEYKPYPVERVEDIIAKTKRIIPKWVRIQRIQRDIPANQIVAGVKKGNLRECVYEKLSQEGARCQCIRCREVGHVERRLGVRPRSENIHPAIERYLASDGEELFLSYEDVQQDILIGFLRLRHPSEEVHRPEIRSSRAMLVRELHVYGPVVPLGSREEQSWQHHGYGRRLLREAERIAKEEYDALKLVIISGVGAKPYYYRWGYKRDGPYVSKEL